MENETIGLLLFLRIDIFVILNKKNFKKFFRDYNYTFKILIYKPVLVIRKFDFKMNTTYGFNLTLKSFVVILNYPFIYLFIFVNKESLENISRILIKASTNP